MTSLLPSSELRGVENTLRQLLNDMRTIVEARCMKHGAGGGTTANSAAGLLPFIGIEIIASRTSNGSKDEAIRHVFSEIATRTGYQPYGTIGFPLFKLVRNGLAHGFWPNEAQLANGPSCKFVMSFWIDGNTHRSVCIDDVGERAESNHLARLSTSPSVVFQVSAQHLCRDIADYIEGFLQSLASDTALQKLVEANASRMANEARVAATIQLSPADTIALGL